MIDDGYDFLVMHLEITFIILIFALTGFLGSNQVDQLNQFFWLFKTCLFELYDKSIFVITLLQKDNKLNRNSPIGNYLKVVVIEVKSGDVYKKA